MNVSNPYAALYIIPSIVSTIRLHGMLDEFERVESPTGTFHRRKEQGARDRPKTENLAGDAPTSAYLF
ncbi:MAG: hypothetical protein M1836_003999 [Candelina mexicana]|nr:MAG: hypothetical protein M1836_003999 [Candelina mexicana]